MGFLENNLIPNIHGMVFTINTENEIDRAKVKQILAALPEIEKVEFNIDVYPNEMTVSTKKVLAIGKFQQALIPHRFHALRKTLTGL